MLKVLGRTSSINVQKVMWIAAELGIEVNQTNIGGPYGGNDKPEYIALNPNKRVPTMIDGDHVQWESNSCVRYLAAREGKAPWYANDLTTRGHADMWMDWASTTVQPEMTVIYWGLIRTPEEDRNYDAIEKSRQNMCDIWARLDKQLASNRFIAGDEISIGDVPAVCFSYRWHTLDIDRPDLPNLRAWYEGIAARPAFKQHVMLPLV
ncbi:MAG: glutathione S-transferase family protein [Rhodospirillales bacterium]|jgi:glutathione S-transferase